MWWFVVSALAGDILRVGDELPTTLLPLYAKTDADLRAQELIFDRLFYRTPVA